MKVLDLQCSLGHAFEGWFASEQEYLSQCASSLVSCPVCGDVSIHKKLSAPRLNLSGAKAPAGPAEQKSDGLLKQAGAWPLDTPTPSPELQHALHEAWIQVAKHVVETTDDVGERFAEEARRIHYGETEDRGIRGRATPDEARELMEEGIALMAIPIPEHLKKPLQ